MSNLFKLFTTAFFQVFFVAGSTACIAHKHYIGTAITGFAISYIWTFNVRRIAASTLPERIAYASGAATGSVTGMALSTTILNLLA